MSYEDILRDCLAQLRSPVHSTETLLTLLAKPLAVFGTLPDNVRHQLQINVSSSEPLNIIPIIKFIPEFQLALLQVVLPTWKEELERDSKLFLVEAYFYQEKPSDPISAECILATYSTLLTKPFNLFTVRLLTRVMEVSSISMVFEHLFVKNTKAVGPRWDDYIRQICSIPGRAANAQGHGLTNLPSILEYRENTTWLCNQLHKIMKNKYFKHNNDQHVEAIAVFLSRLVGLGTFQKLDHSPSIPLFSLIRAESVDHNEYWQNWQSVISSVPYMDQRSLLSSTFSSIELPSLDPKEETRRSVKREAILLKNLIGDFSPIEEETWTLVSATFARSWRENVARVIVCWAALSVESHDVLVNLVNFVLQIWSDENHIKHSLLSKHQFTTALLLLSISQLPPQGDAIKRISLTPMFISAVGVYIGHLDPSVRRCGMLGAEVIAALSGKSLNFEAWEGEGEGIEWARNMRGLISKRDADADLTTPLMEEHSQEDHDFKPPVHRVRIVSNEGDSDDDSLVGYASSHPSTRSPSPTPSEQQDPTLLNPTKKKIQRPVYLLDLAALLKVQQEGNEQAESIEMALQVAPSLIRRKREFGLELDENAVDLTYNFIALQNNYELKNFDERVLEAVLALVVCCPRKVAPYIIEQFFSSSYSTHHRFTMLNALSIGARELAGLSIPAPTEPLPSFPTRLLPPSAHKKYIQDEDAVAAGAGAKVRGMVQGLTRLAIDDSRKETEEKIPELVRERQLRIRNVPRAGAIVELDKLSQPVTQVTLSTTFTQVAAEYFIGPLISRFWRYLNESLGHEERAIKATGGYRATGTGRILNPLILSHLVNSLAIMVHASRNTPAFLSVISPNSLEMALTLGTRRMTVETNPASSMEDEAKNAASVLRACLELAIVVLDACLDLDKAKSITQDHGLLVSGVGAWAEQVFSQLDSGLKMDGAGGMEEGKLYRAAAGLVLQVDQIKSRWKQSLIEF